MIHSSNSLPVYSFLKDDVYPVLTDENKSADTGDASIRQIGDWLHGEIVAVCTKPYVTYMLEGKYLEIVNIANPRNPELITEIKLPSMGTCIFEDDSILYIGYGPWSQDVKEPEGGFYVYDVADAGEPKFIGAYTANARVVKIEIREQTAFILTESSSLEIVDITIPTDITLLGSYTYIHEGGFRNHEFRDFELSDSYALVAGGDRGLVVIDISDVTNPTETTSCDTPDGFGYGIEVEWPYAYLADGHGGLSSFDITDYTTPQILDTLFVENEYSRLSLMSAFFLDDIIFSSIMGSGLAVIDVSDPLDLQEIEQYNLGGEVGFVEPSGYGNILTCPENRQGLHIIDIRNPEEQLQLAIYSNPSYIKSIEVYGNHALIGNTFDGLRVLDISNISDIQCESFFDGVSIMDDLEMLGSRVYISEGNHGLAIVDIHNISTPFRMEYNSSSDQMMGTSVLIDKRFVYLASSVGGFFVYEISLESNVTLITSLPVDVSYPADMVQVSDTIYIVDEYGRFFIIDVSNPNVPVLLSDTPIPGNARAIEVVGGYAYIGTIYDGLTIIDITNSAAPSIVSTYLDDGLIVDLERDGNLLFVSDTKYGLSILDISNPVFPERIAYFNSTEMNEYYQSIQVTQGMIFIAMSYAGLIVLEYDHDGNGIFSRQEFHTSLQTNSITPLQDVTLYEIGSNYTIQWDLSLIEDSWIELRSDSELISMYYPNSSEGISISFQNVSLGSSIHSIEIWDSFGIHVQDIVILKVTNQTQVATSAIIFGIIVGGSICVIIVFVVVVLKRER